MFVNICPLVARGYGQRLFHFAERYCNWSNSAAGTSNPGLQGRPLTLRKVGRTGLAFNFSQHQHLIADLTGAQAYKRFTLFLWMYILFTIQSIKYLPISQPTAPCSVFTSLLLKADQIGDLAPLQKWTEQAAGRGPYFMPLSEHIAIKGVESLSEGTREGCGSLIPSHLHPPTLQLDCLCQAQYIHRLTEHPLCEIDLGETDGKNAHFCALVEENKPSGEELRGEHPGIKLSLHQTSMGKVHGLKNQNFGLKFCFVWSLMSVWPWTNDLISRCLGFLKTLIVPVSRDCWAPGARHIGQDAPDKS